MLIHYIALGTGTGPEFLSPEDNVLLFACSAPACRPHFKKSRDQDGTCFGPSFLHVAWVALRSRISQFPSYLSLIGVRVTSKEPSVL